jgi:hypothetical protein
MFKIYEAKGYEVFANWDSSAQVFELFLSDTGGDYIGCADTRIEAKELAKRLVAEM